MASFLFLMLNRWKFVAHLQFLCLIQEIYRPGTAISHARRSKQRIQGQRIILREKGPRGGIKICCYCIFHIDQKAKKYAH